MRLLHELAMWGCFATTEPSKLKSHPQFTSLHVQFTLANTSTATGLPEVSLYDNNVCSFTWSPDWQSVLSLDRNEHFRHIYPSMGEWAIAPCRSACMHCVFTHAFKIAFQLIAGKARSRPSAPWYDAPQTSNVANLSPDIHARLHPGHTVPPFAPVCSGSHPILCHVRFLAKSFTPCCIKSRFIAYHVAVADAYH